jgi:hypothetical protein
MKKLCAQTQEGQELAGQLSAAEVSAAPYKGRVDKG